MRWIIGDLHGMIRPLDALLSAIGKADSKPQFLFIGDYVNRGPASKQCIDLLLALPDARFLRGNHDDIFDLLINGQSFSNTSADGDPYAAFEWFMQHGLDLTLTSYGVDWADLEFLLSHRDEQRLRDILSCIPESHRQFVRNLPGTIEDDGLFLIHGRWGTENRAERLASRLAADPVLRRTALWGRFDVSDILAPKAWRRIGYFGHTAVDNYPLLKSEKELVPLVFDKMVLLDTGAALYPNGRLTAYCHESRQFMQADRQGRVLPP